MTEKQHVWPLLKKNLPQVHWMRLENLVGTGMADCNGCYRGREAWIENKVVKGNRIIFQKTQPAWLIGRAAHGGRVFVLARKEDDLLLYAGGHLKSLVLQAKPQKNGDLVVRYDAIAPVEVFSRPYDWPKFLSTIFLS